MSDVLWFRETTMSDLPQVGGKNASLGEMVSGLAGAGVRVPDGFATTADANRAFLSHDDLGSRIRSALRDVDPSDVRTLARVAAEIRAQVEHQPFPPSLEQSIRSAYARLLTEQPHPDRVTWAVRSSATAEDLPDASFAGQQETFLNISGIDNLLDAIRKVYASLYTDRAIVYRAQHGFSEDDIAISAGVQLMVRSDIGASGVMFTVDTESGFDQVVFITSAYGLGETVVQGTVNPDEFYVYKPALRAGRPSILRRELGTKAVALRYGDGASTADSTVLTDVSPAERSRFSITDEQIEDLARMALAIENHYGRAMDIEWALDGVDGMLYIVQARPETVVTRRDSHVMRRYVLQEHDGDVLATGRAVGERIGAGRVRVMHDLTLMHLFQTGDVLVADRTDPDWEPIMRRASAIVTDSGGRTCHAAIVARELGIPAVVGTETGTNVLTDGSEVTVCCSEGDDGTVYRGILSFSVEETPLDVLPDLPVDLMLNVGVPDQAFALAELPNRGVGLARLEFIVGSIIGIHPRALLDFDTLPEPLKTRIGERTAAYPTPRDFFVRRLAEGISTIAAAFAPKPVIVRMSDFKTNEYATLLGGDAFEPHEENPMLGWRGASRYTTPSFRGCFDLECEALRHVRERMGLKNLKIMIPFVRTLDEAAAVVALLAENGLRRGDDGLEIVMMCEIPSNALLADRFLDHFDGFSIGSNDLTQLTLGVDRDSAAVAGSFDERDPAVLALLELAIEACNRRGAYIGICGQGPSDHPELAEWLLARGIRSMSLNADAIAETWMRLATAATTERDGRVGAQASRVEAM